MKLTPEKLSAFVHVLAETCQVGKACAAIDISRVTAYKWRQNNPEFAAAWDEALRIGLTYCEDEMHRRAYDGVEKPVFHQGMQCGTIREYSDTLAIFLAKAHAPEKYRENQHKLELSGHLALSQMSDDEIRAELASIASPPTPPDDGSDLV